MAETTVGLKEATYEIENPSDVEYPRPVLNAAGQYVREFRVYGQVQEGQSNPPLVFTVRLTSATAEPLEVTIPSTVF